MTPEEREAFYDREIAPQLMELARKCEAENMSFLAMVEWIPGESGKTMSVREESGIATKTVLWAMRANGNADSLILALRQHGKEHGHNSIYLSMLER